ncbi:MAG: NFACT family protein [Oscillospiraceae bacterium]|nr:NFACT family protein [Oscillospiraceae bacterium]
MALDGAFLNAVKDEISFLKGGRVDKIHQPSRDEIIITMRAAGGSHKLLISSSANSAGVYITKSAVENPKAPPMFCMLLRKHIGSGKLMDIRQDGLERILCLDFEAMSEIGDMVNITISAEIMGRHSNLIIINQDGKIIDGIKRVDSEISRERMVLPGLKYELPPRESRLDFRECSADDIKSSLESLPDGALSKCLIKIFEGIAPIVAREWVFYAARGEILKSEMNDDIFNRLCFYIKKTAADFKNGENTYTTAQDRNGLLKDFTFLPIRQYGALMLTKTLPSACETLDFFYSERDAAARMKQREGDLYRLLINLTERIARRNAAQKEELILTAERDALKLKGDLISANIYMIKKGMSSVTVQNFYDEKGGEMTIPLDIRLTPSLNMQKYYSEYRKAASAEKILTKQIENGEKELDYIDSVYDALTRAKTEDEVNELRAELSEQGYLRSAKLKKAKAVKSAPPHKVILPEGFEVLIGRNNKQNDLLTCKTAEKTDIWLHTKDIPGSHVIIKTNGNPNPPESVILQAAQLAAFHSKAKASSRVPVDYVPVKYVKKPAGAKPGMVIFTNNKTLYVNPQGIGN